MTESPDADGEDRGAYMRRFTLELLRLILTFQIRKQIAANRLGIAPRFELVVPRRPSLDIRVVQCSGLISPDTR